MCNALLKKRGTGSIRNTTGTNKLQVVKVSYLYYDCMSVVRTLAAQNTIKIYKINLKLQIFFFTCNEDQMLR